MFGTVPGLEPAMDLLNSPAPLMRVRAGERAKQPGCPPALRGAGGRVLFSFFTTHPVETQGRGMPRNQPACHPALCWFIFILFQQARPCFQGWVMRWTTICGLLPGGLPFRPTPFFLPGRRSTNGRPSGRGPQRKERSMAWAADDNRPTLWRQTEESTCLRRRKTPDGMRKFMFRHPKRQHLLHG